MQVQVHSDRSRESHPTISFAEWPYVWVWNGVSISHALWFKQGLVHVHTLDFYLLSGQLCVLNKVAIAVWRTLMSLGLRGFQQRLAYRRELCNLTMFWSLELILISQNSKGMSCSLLVWLAAAGSIIWGCVPKQCETHKRRLHSYITYQVLKFALHSYSNHPIQLGDNRLIWSYF